MLVARLKLARTFRQICILLIFNDVLKAFMISSLQFEIELFTAIRDHGLVGGELPGGFS